MSHALPVDSQCSTETEPESELVRELFARLDARITELWAIGRRGRFWTRVAAGGCSRELYRATLGQIYHYTRHNSLNQAVTALRADPEQLGLLRFVYSHAREELGHEQLVLHDLESLELLPEGRVKEPALPATDALIQYLYGVALREGPIPRLGYSYWAESVYGQIGPLLFEATRALGLTRRNLTFFAAHSEIDTRHAEQVRSAIRRAVKSPAQAEALERVAVTSLWLTLQMLEQVCDAAPLVPEQESK
jgi:pyrroloquinoline quinone (PQQ) biosynthesis protein C